jgi:hypothetical protein
MESPDGVYRRTNEHCIAALLDEQLQNPGNPQLARDILSVN